MSARMLCDALPVSLSIFCVLRIVYYKFCAMGIIYYFSRGEEGEEEGRTC